MENNINVYIFECWDVTSHNKETGEIRKSTLNIACLPKKDRKTISRGNIFTSHWCGEETFFCTDKNKLSKYRREIIKKNKNVYEKYSRRQRSVSRLGRTLKQVRGLRAKMNIIDVFKNYY